MKRFFILLFPLSGLLFIISLMIGSGADPKSEFGQKMLTFAWYLRWILPIILIVAIIGLLVFK